MLRSEGLPEDRFPKTIALLRQGVAGGVAPGMVAGVWLAERPDLAWVHAAGSRRIVPSAQPLAIDTVFDLASLTKVMGTATLAALLVERRWVDWETPIRAFLPDFPSSEVKLSHLLSHTSGLVAWLPFWEMLRKRFGQDPRILASVPIPERQAEMRRLVTRIAPERAPGEREVYSDLSFLLLGFALEESLRMDLDRAIERLLWRPMALETARFRRVDRDAIEGRDESVAATEDCPWRKAVIQGQVHDDNCWAMGGYAGHAGAFGTVTDVLTFAARLFEGFLSRETIQRAWARVGRPAGCSRTLGWDTPCGADSLVGVRFRPGTVGHWGFTGTGLWIDPAAGVAVSLLTNRVHPSREHAAIRAFRPLFHNAIREDLGR